MDDDSSDEDRGKMLENYGEYTLIFKVCPIVLLVITYFVLFQLLLPL